MHILQPNMASLMLKYKTILEREKHAIDQTTTTANGLVDYLSTITPRYYT
jgi:hypothetical protein